MDFHKAKSKELQQTNFFMGKYHPEYNTAYSQAFSKPRAFSAALEDKYSFTATHFTFGNSSSISESEAKSRYKSVDAGSESTKVGINRFETSKHHFDLGTDTSKFNTTANDTFINNGTFHPEDFRTYLRQNRQMNFTFGSENREKLSITKTDYKPKNDFCDRRVRDNIRIQQKTTHFRVGELENEYKTSHNEEFKDKSRINKPRSYSPNKYSLSLGEYRPNFVSEKQQSFNIKLMETPHAGASQKLNDMLGTNFKLGDRSSSKKTISQESFSTRNFKDPSQISPETKKTSVILGNSKASWHTSNENAGKNFYKVEKSDYPYKGSFVVMGFDSKKNCTTTQENYKRYAGVNANSLDPFTNDDIKKRHFSFGSTDPKYQTCNTNYGYLRGSQQKPDEKFINELKGVHFSLGNDGASMMSTTMSEFTKKKTFRIKPSDNLKSHSIVLGTHQNTWLTTKSIGDARRTIS